MAVPRRMSVGDIYAGPGGYGTGWGSGGSLIKVRRSGSGDGVEDTVINFDRHK